MAAAFQTIKSPLTGDLLRLAFGPPDEWKGRVSRALGVGPAQVARLAVGKRGLALRHLRAIENFCIERPRKIRKRIAAKPWSKEAEALRQQLERFPKARRLAAQLIAEMAKSGRAVPNARSHLGDGIGSAINSTESILPQRQD
jgi:hypothetical protein